MELVFLNPNAGAPTERLGFSGQNGSGSGRYHGRPGLRLHGAGKGPQKQKGRHPENAHFHNIYRFVGRK